MVTSRKETERSPVYDFLDEDRIKFVEENAVSIVLTFSNRIRFQRERLAFLEKSRNDLKKNNKLLLEENKKLKEELNEAQSR